MEAKVFTFFARKKLGVELSNFYECKVVIDGHTYKSGEAAFHGMKFIILAENTKDKERSKELETYGKKFEANNEFGSLKQNEIKKKGGKSGLKLTPKEQSIWSKKGPGVQKKICLYKYINHKEVREALMNTENKFLVHPAMRVSNEKMSDKIWEGRVVIDDEKNCMKVLGGNKLGQIWMDIRDNKN